MNVLVLNCGSSSVKFQLFDMDDEDVLAKGLIEKIGSSEAIFTYTPRDGDKIVQTREILSYDAALALAFGNLMHPQHGVIESKAEIDAVGHRIVHGGEEFVQSVLITEEVKEGVRRCIQFAPLHNPYNLKGIEVCERILEGVPQVGVFDTAFHHTLHPKSYMYALPMALYRKLRIRRYGFHGTSHAYVANRAAEHLGVPIKELKIITCHLGNGCSITAVDSGKSAETSMGFTPLEGLVMGTRCGDIDPALVTYIARSEGLSLSQVDSLMNKSSGMLGLTETSNDFREIEIQAEQGSEQHILAMEIFCHRIKKYIGAYAAVMGGVDVVVFTAGIGENSSYVRKRCLEDMAFLGIEIDEAANAGSELDIGVGPVKVLVVPTNEELAIARDTQRILKTVAKEVPEAVPEKVPGQGPAQLSPDDKAELLALWLEEPNASIVELVAKLRSRIGKSVGAAVVARELAGWGLDQVSEKKREEILSRSV